MTTVKGYQLLKSPTLLLAVKEKNKLLELWESTSKEEEEETNGPTEGQGHQS